VFAKKSEELSMLVLPNFYSGKLRLMGKLGFL
jgi:hypothetical protein